MWYDPFGMVQEEVIALSPSMLQFNPFPSKQEKVHFVGSLGILHHPQPPFNILSLTLHKRNCKPWKNTDLEVLMEKTKQNQHSSAALH
jgi:hypothetical protein